MNESMPPRAVFLDRDGTLVRHVHYLHRPEDVELLPGVASGLATALAHGARLFLFTNQSGVGRGLFSLADVEAVNRRMIELLDLGRDPFTATCIATEPPGATIRYRKPAPRFILETLDRHRIAPSDAVMVGDNTTDWQAGLNAGIRAVAVRSHLLDAAAEDFLRTAGIRLYDGVAQWSAAEWPARFTAGS